jgi:hypothetical protein
MERKSRMGRPPLAPDEKLMERVAVHLRRDDYAILARKAKARGVRVGALAREILERALRRMR